MVLHVLHWRLATFKNIRVARGPATRPVESLVFKLTLRLVRCHSPTVARAKNGHIRAIIKLFWVHKCCPMLFNHSFSGQIHGIFPSPDFSRCMYVYNYIYICISLSLSLSLASACSTIALLFVSRLFARKTRRKFVQISSQKYREFRASNHFF